MEFKSAIFVKYLRALYNVNLKKTNKIHATLIEAIFKVFVQAEDDINQMALELCLTTATGKWLDLWGDYFGIMRKAEEPDEKYVTRLIAEIIEPKATINALRKSATRWLNLAFDKNYQPNEIVIYEPWRDLLVTSQRGSISYLGRLPDSEYWTHGIVDISIPDSSEMSSELIEYLNTIKACGVQISWHISMSWEVLTGYFTQDSVRISIEKYYDIWVKRDYGEVDGIRTSCEWTLLDDVYNTPLSVIGYLSGHCVNNFDHSISRDFEPFRLTSHIVQNNPIINMDDIAYFNGVEFDNLTAQQVIDLELDGDRQIPNLDNLGLVFEEELKRYLDTPIKEIINELEDSTLEQLEENQFVDKDVSQIKEMFDKDSDGLTEFLNNWRTHNYFNKTLNVSPLSTYAGPLKILIETDT